MAKQSKTIISDDAQFGDDRPIESSAQDRLGFSSSAKHVARSIVEFSSPEGFVFGIEGEWGSGKTSLINLISDQLRSSDTPPEIVKFSPWLISSHEGLLGELFHEIAQAAIKIDLAGTTLPDQTGPPNPLKRICNFIKANKRAANRKEIEKALKGFSRHMARLGHAALLADAVVPGAGVVARLWMKAAGKAASTWAEGPTLEVEKKN